MASEHHCHSGGDAVRIGSKLKITGGIFLAVFALSFLPVLEPLNEGFVSYLQLIWWAVLLGLLIGGVIDYFVPEGFIYSYLGGRRRRSVFNAVAAGLLLSGCSHGILAIAIQLYKKGAGVPAVIAFLLASPWANLPITILMFGFFGWKALLIIAAAIVVALITGHVYLLLERKEWIEQAVAEAASAGSRWRAFTEFDAGDALRGVYRGTINLANMVLWWILIGFLLAVFLKAYLPHDWFMNYFGPDLPGLLLTLLGATVIEVCSEGSSPIAFEIYNQIGTLGNPFVFLMAGVITDYTEIGLLWTNIGKRTALWLPVIAVPQVLLLGYLFNFLPI